MDGQLLGTLKVKLMHEPTSLPACSHKMDNTSQSCGYDSYTNR